MKKSIYLAAPLFTQAERIWNKKIANAIRKRNPDLNVILPQKEAKKAVIGGVFNFHKLFKLCLEEINKCDIILAILDGSDSDSGTCFEVGYSYAKDKRLIGVRTDIRKGKGEDKALNAMLSESIPEIIEFDGKKDLTKDIGRLAEIIIKLINNIK